MDTTTRPRPNDDGLDRFEAALLGQLRSVVQQRADARRRSRVLKLAGVAAAAATVVGFGVTVGGTSPAFAVTRQADGDVVVTINRLDDAPGLERALAAKGVTADVRYEGGSADANAQSRLDPSTLPAGTHRYSDAECRLMVGQRIYVADDGSFRVLISAAAQHTGDPVTLQVAGSKASDADTLLGVGNRSSGCSTGTQPGSWARWTSAAS